DAIPRGNNAKVDRDKATDAAIAMVADGLLVEA
ncbi:MAG: hypothetical protein ACI970_001619, partial [Myxococcota bacterium]